MEVSQQSTAIGEAMQLALAHHRGGRLLEAEQGYLAVLEAHPGHAEALHRLGEIAYRRGNASRAAELIEQAVRTDPLRPDLHNNLGEVYRAAGRAAEAEKCYRAALSLNPDFAEAHNNLGVALKDSGRLDEAEQSLRRAIAIKPGFAMALNNLGTVLMAGGRLEDAERCLRQALNLNADFPLALNNLGIVLQDFGMHAEAEACYRRALALEPGNAEAHNNLGTLLQDRGRHGEAAACYREALAHRPAYAAAFSNLLLSLNYAPGMEAGEIFAEHLEFARRFAPVPPAPRSFRNRRHRERQLRIGYVSGDLRNHPVAHFLEPVLLHHDRKRFAVHCYSNHSVSDDFTERLKAQADAWRDVHALSDDAAAEAIRADEIDILVDLSGHTSSNRLLVFASKPAPVQASWLGYLNTTGLETVDYRITDSLASPKGMFDSVHSERLVRLPESQWCYQAPSNCPEVSPPPCLRNGFVTFGAFSNLAKITNGVIELWCQLLALMPRSRLVVAGRGLAAGDEEFLSRFVRHGITHDRLELLPYRAFPEYLALHHGVDIVLDTFPYSGGTTSCHALWMGVPLVSLAGNTPPSRGGASLLGAIGLRQLVAKTPEKYLTLASGLAARPAKLAQMRAGMRKRMQESPLMDAAQFTRDLETAYRAMWRTWCAKR